MSNDSFKYYYCLYIWYCTVFSGKLAMATGHAMLINLQCKSLKTCIAWHVAVASFTTDSIIIIHTKARSNYLHWRYSCKTAHAKKVELQYIADLRPCARYLIFKSLENKFFAELCTVTYFNKSKSSRLISHPSKARSYKQTLILQIAHAAFDPLVVRQHFPCDSNFW